MGETYAARGAAGEGPERHKPNPETLARELVKIDEWMQYLGASRTRPDLNGQYRAFLMGTLALVRDSVRLDLRAQLEADYARLAGDGGCGGNGRVPEADDDVGGGG